MSASSGMEESSPIESASARLPSTLGGKLRRLDFLEFGQNRGRVLRLGNHFFLRNHPQLIFVEQETVERDHAVFGSGLDVRVDAEGLVVPNERRDGGRVDHDLKDGDPAGLVTT